MAFIIRCFLIVLLYRSAVFKSVISQIRLPRTVRNMMRNTMIRISLTLVKIKLNLLGLMLIQLRVKLRLMIGVLNLVVLRVSSRKNLDSGLGRTLELLLF